MRLYCLFLTFPVKVTRIAPFYQLISAKISLKKLKLKKYAKLLAYFLQEVAMEINIMTSHTSIWVIICILCKKFWVCTI